MKKLLTISCTALFLVLIIHCNNVDMNIEDNSFSPTSGEKLNTLFDEATTSLKAVGHFDSSNPNFVYTSSHGTKVKINGTCLRLNGNPITGNVFYEFIEIYNRHDMIAANKPTMGIKTSGDQEMMLTGGEFYINIKKDGAQLTTICPITIETKTSNTGGTVTGMQAFNGNITNNNLTWTPANNWDVMTNPSANPSNYTLNVPGFGWFNCDKFYNYPEPKTSITANVPSGFANASQIFVLTKSVPNALGTIAGKFPVGLQCYLIFVTESNGNYVWIAKEQTLIQNHSITFDLKDAKIGKRAEFTSFIYSLN